MAEQISENLTKIITEVSELKNPEEKDIQKIFRKYPRNNSGLYKKSEVLKAYNLSVQLNQPVIEDFESDTFLKNIKMKKVRTISGVTPVTVLTKPFPCPGKCIFCPNDVRMPKSYLSDEPGAQRAARNKFDPYLQTFNRLLAYKNIGHATDKIELIILGGTWTSYPESYRIWFVKRCFDAMNDFETTNRRFEELTTTINQPYKEELLEEIDGSKIEKTYNQIVTIALDRTRENNEKATFEELYLAHKINETAKTRCIGLVIETRPDEININSVIEIRKLGATKVQLGVQSMNDKVLKLNKRGHDVKKTREAINLLRQFGFKIHIHYMPNLYGSTPEKDIQDYKKLFKDINIRPDEIKIYPCSLIKTAELMQIYNKGLWHPYTDFELRTVLKNCIKNTPEYCRITRMIRDICSQDIVVGNKKTNFREEAENEFLKDGIKPLEIRLREIKDNKINLSDLKLNIVSYKTGVSREKFLQFVTKENKIAGFLRLSLPNTTVNLERSDRFYRDDARDSRMTEQVSNSSQVIPGLIRNLSNELSNAAMIREIHVYGQSIEIGDKEKGKAQHIGLGKKLIEEAKNISKANGFNKLNVISSVGTREYYRNNGFKDGMLYQYYSV